MAKKEVKKEEKPSQSSPYRSLKPTTEKDIAMDFAMKAQKNFNNMIKASVLFGSQTKNTATLSSDIDILLIIDDASVNWDLELTAWYREELGKIIQNCDYNREVHVNSVKLTTWWHDLMYGDPVAVNILRYGEVLIDNGGYFTPLKALLQQGKIRSTPEAVYASLQRAPEHLARSKNSQLGAIEGIYWCMIDSSQAALMMAGKLPPSPEHVPDMLKENFVEKGMLKMTYVTAMKNIYTVHKGLTHGERYDVKGIHIDEWQAIAEEFLKEMTRIIDQLIETQREQDLPTENKEI